MSVNETDAILKQAGVPEVQPLGDPLMKQLNKVASGELPSYAMARSMRQQEEESSRALAGRLNEDTEVQKKKNAAELQRVQEDEARAAKNIPWSVKPVPK